MVKDKGHEAVDILQKNFEMELRHFALMTYDDHITACSGMAAL